MTEAEYNEALKELGVVLLDIDYTKLKTILDVAKIVIHLDLINERLILEDNDIYQKENEELKAQIEYYKNGVADILNNADSEIGELRELLGLVYVDEKELDQLREKVKQQAEQIEKMKCCGNCNKLAFIISPCFSGCCKLDNHKTELKNNCDKWELAE